MAQPVPAERPNPDPACIIEQLDRLQRDLAAVRDESDQSERLGVLGTLASMIAHEVRGIAAKVAATAQLIERNAHDPDRVRDLASRVTRLGLHAGRVAEAILAAADEPLPGDCSILEIHRRALDALPSEARPRVDDSGLCPRLRACIDPDALERVLVNLYLNAWRAVGGSSGTGTIRVHARRSSPPVGRGEECSTWNTLEIRVADDGPGIHPEMAEEVFEPWQRGPAPGNGHGLGLALCRHLVASVGGTIRFETHPANGAEVVIELPESPAIRLAA
jgi:two-component system nitrogen regulation sensor histidine kinase GlnL